MTRRAAGSGWVALATLTVVAPARGEEPASSAGSAAPYVSSARAAELPDLATGGLPVGLDSVIPSGPTLNLYGFADMSYYRPLVSPSNPWLQFLPKYPSFVSGSLNLYLDGHLSEKWRSLAEVRFLYSPNGADSEIDSAGGQRVVSTELDDPVEPGRRLTWGGISIQRAWLEYAAHPLLTVRAGHFLTPMGIWNVDHGSPVVIGIRQPFIVRHVYFPESQTGVEIYGSHETSLARLGYHLTLSNGYGPAKEYRDFDYDKAIGGRLFAEHIGPLAAKIGLSYYTSHARYLHWQYSLLNGLPLRNEVVDYSYRMQTIASDLRLTYRGLHFQTEWLNYQQAYDDGGHQAVPGRPGTWFTDFSSWGIYGLLGYRTRFFGVMPYLTTEYFHEGAQRLLYLVGGDVRNVLVFYCGINIRPIDEAVIKVEVARGTFPNAGAGSWGEHSMSTFQVQVAWVF